LAPAGCSPEDGNLSQSFEFFAGEVVTGVLEDLTTVLVTFVVFDDGSTTVVVVTF